MSAGYDRVDDEAFLLAHALSALRARTSHDDAVARLERVLLRAGALEGLDRAEMNELLRRGGKLLELLDDD